MGGASSAGFWGLVVVGLVEGSESLSAESSGLTPWSSAWRLLQNCRCAGAVFFCLAAALASALRFLALTSASLPGSTSPSFSAAAAARSVAVFNWFSLAFVLFSDVTDETTSSLAQASSSQYASLVAAFPSGLKVNRSFPSWTLKTGTKTPAWI